MIPMGAARQRSLGKRIALQYLRRFAVGTLAAIAVMTVVFWSCTITATAHRMPMIQPKRFFRMGMPLLPVDTVCCDRMLIARKKSHFGQIWDNFSIFMGQLYNMDIWHVNQKLCRFGKDRQNLTI